LTLPQKCFPDQYSIPPKRTLSRDMLQNVVNSDSVWNNHTRSHLRYSVLLSPPAFDARRRNPLCRKRPRADEAGGASSRITGGWTIIPESSSSSVATVRAPECPLDPTPKLLFGEDRSLPAGVGEDWQAVPELPRYVELGGTASPPLRFGSGLKFCSNRSWAPWYPSPVSALACGGIAGYGNRVIGLNEEDVPCPRRDGTPNC